MHPQALDARAHLLTLVGRPISGLRGGAMTVLEVRDRAVVVRTQRAPEGTTIPIAWVQRGIDLLVHDGETSADAAALGRRSQFIGAVLLTLPGAAPIGDPPRIALSGGRRSPLPSIAKPVAGIAWPAALLASSAAVAVTTYVWTSSPARPLVTTWFLLVCPGMALVRLLPQRGALTAAVLAIATSLSLETLLAETMLEANLWSPGSTLAILLAVTIAGSLAQLYVEPASISERAHST
jgi:hypothetical protein